MSYEWGRAPEAGRWQRAVPVWLMSVMLMAVASGAGMWWVRQTFVWTPLQRFYLSAYLRSALASSLAIRSGRYRLLLMVNRRGTRLAIDEEVVPLSTPRAHAASAVFAANHIHDGGIACVLTSARSGTYRSEDRWSACRVWTRALWPVHSISSWADNSQDRPIADSSPAGWSGRSGESA
jgi:hypothetical protein